MSSPLKDGIMADGIDVVERMAEIQGLLEEDESARACMSAEQQAASAARADEIEAVRADITRDSVAKARQAYLEGGDSDDLDKTVAAITAAMLHLARATDDLRKTQGVDYAEVVAGNHAPQFPRNLTLAIYRELDSIGTARQSGTDPNTNMIGSRAYLLDKLTAKIPELTPGKEFGIDVTPHGKGPRTLSTIELSYDTMELSSPISLYERQVNEVIASFWLEGHKQISLVGLWRAMTGSTRKPHRDELEKLDKAVEKLAATRARIDFTDEAHLRGLDDVGSWKRRTYLLKLEADEVRLRNGLEQVVYTIVEEPLLLAHARLFGNQMTTVPMRVVRGIAEAVSMTDTSMAIRDYLTKRVKTMEHNRRMTPTILHATLFSECGIDGSRGETRARALKTADKILDKFVTEGLIEGYERKDGDRRKKVEGRYTVELKPSPGKGKGGRGGKSVTKGK